MPAPSLSDFPDRLPPMLVKELRQGLRARGFLMLFVTLQLLITLCLLLVGASTDWESAGSASSNIIFAIFFAVALLFQPMRGLTALSAEITGNTMEMMTLTRLNAWRIVFGKWTAIASQTGLMLITLIPYLIMRYFYGGMNVTGELVLLALIFLTSLALTAVSVGLSTANAKLARVLPVVGIFFLVITGSSRFLFRGSGPFSMLAEACSLTDSGSRWGIFVYVCVIAYLGWCALSHGAAAIAPAAENHSTIRRLIALALGIVVTAVAVFTTVEAEIVGTLITVIVAPALLVALTERNVVLPPVCKPFVKLGPAGRPAALFLLPGWPSGVFFSLLLIALHAICVFGSGEFRASGTIMSDLKEEVVVELSIIGSILLAALLTALFTKQEEKRATHFFIFLLMQIGIAIFAGSYLSFSNREKLLWLFIWNPLAFIPLAGELSSQIDIILKACCVLTSIILAALVARAFRGFLQHRDAFAGMETAPPATASATES